MVRRIIPTVAALLLAAAPCAFAQVETVAQFNPSLLETPESIAIDHDNNTPTPKFQIRHCPLELGPWECLGIWSLELGN